MTLNDHFPTDTPENGQPKWVRAVSIATFICLCLLAVVIKGVPIYERYILHSQINALQGEIADLEKENAINETQLHALPADGLEAKGINAALQRGERDLLKKRLELDRLSGTASSQR